MISDSLKNDILLVATLAHIDALIIIGGGRDCFQTCDWESDLVSMVDKSSSVMKSSDDFEAFLYGDLKLLSIF